MSRQRNDNRAHRSTPRGQEFILQQLADIIKDNYPSANIININKEKKRYAAIRTDADLNTFLEGKLHLGLRNVLVGSDRTKDIEKVMENAVYLHLKNLGFKVSIGVLPNAEIDFVAERNGKPLYFQVTYLLSERKTIEREFGTMLRLPDNYDKYVITMDPISRPKDYQGITQLSLRQFLLKEDF